MHISLSLLRSFLDLKASAEEIGEALTLLGIEVDQIEEEIFTLSLTPNLGHCLSALGIARELSAAFQLPLVLPEISLPQSKKKLPLPVSVAHHDHCPRYMGQLIENVQIAPSPSWLQKELEAAKIQPICNAVDITNYILLKYGQPLHAFDADQIESISVQCSEAPFSFTGLDEIEREIPPGTLYIADGKKPISLAGILGGLESAISGKTSRIFLQAAVYHPMRIRRASKALHLRTESALRFEKGVDPNGIPRALDEACKLFLELCSATLASERIDLKKGSFPQKSISCRKTRVNQILGSKLSLTEIEEIFQRLDFPTKTKPNETLQVEIPTYRFDLEEEIDLVEEVARIYGYNNLEKGSALCTVSPHPHDPLYLFEEKLRQSCSGLGLQEFLTSDLISPKLAWAALEIAAPQISLLKALHAKTEEYSVLRPSLLPGLLQVVQSNLDQKNRSIAAFEIGRIHFLQKEEAIELPMGALILTGEGHPLHWSEKAKEVDFYDIKGLVETLLEAMHLSPPRFETANHISFHPGRQANIFCGDLLIGSLGEVHPSLLAKFGIDQRVLFAEMHLQYLYKLQKKSLRMAPLSQFPASERDWTLSLPPKALIAPLFDAIASLHLPLLEKAELINLYQPIDAPQKNVTFRFTYRDPLKTVSFEDVEKEHAKLVQHLTKLIHSENL